MANISDVAKLAGLSVSTVSRVINNQKYVTEEKKQAVIKAMKALNYKPSTVARQLRGVHSSIIGVIVPRITNPFFSYLIDELQKQAAKNNFRIMIFQSDESKEKERSFLNLLQQKQIDGIIMCAVENDEQVISSYTQYGPIILCNERLLGSSLPMITFDQEKGAYIGTRYLLSKGYNKIAYCTGGNFDEKSKGNSRDKGFLKALEEFQCSFNSEWLFTNQHTIEDGKKLAQYFFSLTDRPNSIFTGSDEVAAGFISEANRLGIRIPKDIAVLGFDNQVISSITTPGITTIQQPTDILGKQVMKCMLSLLNDNDYTVDRESLTMKLIIRESA